MAAADRARADARHRAKYDALAVMLAKITRTTVSGPDRRLKLIARFGVGYDTSTCPLTDTAFCSRLRRRRAPAMLLR